MADNIAVTPGSGATVAADEIAGVKYQRVKLVIGADGANDGDASATTPLPVDGSGVTQPVKGAKTNNAAAPGATNVGTLPAVATSAAPSYTEGNQAALSTDLSGAVRVTGSLSVGGTTDNSAFTAGSSTGTPALGFYHSTIDTVTDGRAAAIAIDSKRNMLSVIRDAAGNARGVNVTSGNALTVDGSASTQPVSAASLPLPSGASTSAKQPALGTAGTPSSDVITVQGVTSMTALKVDGSAVTQPVSGTVTSTIAAGATTIAKAEDVASADADVGVPSMAIRKATPANTSGTDGDYEMLQMSAGRLWVDASGKTLTVDGSGVTQPVSGTVTANAGTGTMAVSLASVPSHAVTNAGTFAVQAEGNVANAATDSGNPIKIGGVGKTANPTAVTDGQRVNATFDKLGKQVVVGSIRDLKARQVTTITSSTSETTVITAIASTFADVYGIIVTNTSATVCAVTFKDSTAGTTVLDISVPANDTRGLMLPESAALKQTTVNNNWTATCGTSVASIKITMLYIQNT